MHTDTTDHYYIFCVLMDYQVSGDAEQAYQALKRRDVNFRDKSILPRNRALLSEIYRKVHPYQSNAETKQGPVSETGAANN